MEARTPVQTGFDAPARQVGTLLLGAILLAASLVRPLAAQEDGASVGASFEAAMEATTIQGDLAGVASGAILLELTPRFAVGGAASFMMGGHELTGSVPGSDLKLRTAFGGALGQFVVMERGPVHLWVRLLAAVGNGKVELAVAGTEIASDNFGILSPEMGATLPLLGPLQAGLSTGYRATIGVQDLPGVTASDLQGPFLRAHVSFHVF